MPPIAAVKCVVAGSKTGSKERQRERSRERERIPRRESLRDIVTNADLELQNEACTSI